MSPIEPSPLPLSVRRFVTGAVVAVAMGVLAEQGFAKERDSMTLGLYGAFTLLAFMIGATQHTLGWVIGFLLLPSYWCSALSRWPSTSTVGMGCYFSVLFAIPHAVAAQLGMWFGQSRRARRAARGAVPSSRDTR